MRKTARGFGETSNTLMHACVRNQSASGESVLQNDGALRAAPHHVAGGGGDKVSKEQHETVHGADTGLCRGVGRGVDDQLSELRDDRFSGPANASGSRDEVDWFVLGWPVQ